MWRSSLFWQDADGRGRHTRLVSVAGAPNTIASLWAMSNAQLIYYFEGPPTVIAPPAPGAFNYDDVGYMGAIQTTDLFGNANRIFLPAPMQVYLLADLETFNAASPAWAGLAGVAAAELRCTWSGFPIGAIGPGWVTAQSYGMREYFPIANVPAPVYVREMIWVDVHGNSTYTLLVSNAGAPFTMGALQVMSNAFISEWWEAPATFVLNAALGNAFRGVNDAAEFVFADSAGNRSTVVLPAPFAALFLADGETIDPANGFVVTLIANVAAELINPGTGLALTTFVGGRRARFGTRLAT